MHTEDFPITCQSQLLGMRRNLTAMELTCKRYVQRRGMPVEGAALALSEYLKYEQALAKWEQALARGDLPLWTDELLCLCYLESSLAYVLSDIVKFADTA